MREGIYSIKYAAWMWKAKGCVKLENAYLD